MSFSEQYRIRLMIMYVIIYRSFLYFKKTLLSYYFYMILYLLFIFTFSPSKDEQKHPIGHDRTPLQSYQQEWEHYR
jgi:hypothetical protein